MILRWLISRRVRDASNFDRHIRRSLRAQCDQLAPAGIAAIQTASDQLRAALRANAPAEQLKLRVADLEKVAHQWLKAYPHAGARENVDVVLVALVVALAIRTFFLQPMAIPTGSMQPTLYGVTVENLGDRPDAAIPGFFGRVRDRFLGISYYNYIAKSSGELRVGRPVQVLPLIRKQTFTIGGVPHTIWFPPATLPERSDAPPEFLLFAHANASDARIYKEGESVIRLKVQGGDRLFADRFTLNFRRPRRGDIVIFESTGIPRLTQDTHYIKRLVALSGETVQIGNDRHLVIDEVRLDATTPRFENVYGFDPSQPPQESRYSGHVNNYVAQKTTGHAMAPLFADESARFKVRDDHFLVMGDNTMNSYDSRYWGDFPQNKVIGQCVFVFWPLTLRFGWGFR